MTAAPRVPALLVLALALGAVAAQGPQDPLLLLVDPGNPAAYPKIQDAVDAATQGATILVAPGLYHEGVFTTVPDLTIRGMSRDGVVLWGGAVNPPCEDGLPVGIWGFGTKNLTVDNLTVRNYTHYGVFWEEVEGFYGTRITAQDNCIYGLLTHDSSVGELAWNEASGAGDSGLYTGETYDCRCVLRNNDVHHNMIGYSGTKGNHVVIRDNWFHHNGVGILPNTLTPDVAHYVFEHAGVGNDTPLQCCVVIANNLIEANNNPDVVPHGFTEDIKLPIGTGVELAGASGNIVHGNLIRDHARWGLAIHWLFAVPNGNVVHGNTFSGNAAYDIWWDEWGAGNCFQSNGQVTSDPAPLPACGPLPSVGVPSAAKDLHLALIALGLEE